MEGEGRMVKTRCRALFRAVDYELRQLLDQRSGGVFSNLWLSIESAESLSMGFRCWGSGGGSLS